MQAVVFCFLALFPLVNRAHITSKTTSLQNIHAIEYIQYSTVNYYRLH